MDDVPYEVLIILATNSDVNSIFSCLFSAISLLSIIADGWNTAKFI